METSKKVFTVQLKNSHPAKKELKNRLSGKICENCLWRSINRRLDGYICSYVTNPFSRFEDNVEEKDLVKSTDTCAEWTKNHA